MPSYDNEKFAATTWGQQSAEEELQCPSGQWCLVKRPNPRRLASLGVIDQLDTLSKLVQTKHIDRVKGKPQPPTISESKLAAISEDPKKILEILDIADRVVEFHVVQPHVKRPVKMSDGTEVSITSSERDPNIIYTDQIDDLDKMFIFQHAVGGNPDLATFREQIQSTSGDLADVLEMENSTVGIPSD